MTQTELPPPEPPEAPPKQHGRFTSEVMAGGSVVEKADDELVGGVRGAFGVAVVVALIAIIGLFNVWWLVFVLGLLIAIFLHELGHFMTARWTGMKATQFFIGFGPRVWSFRKGETEYGLRVLPLGAFVRIVGMNSMDEVEPEDEGRTYRSKSFPRRLLVISAGSLMHMLLAIVLLFTVYVADGETVRRDGAEVGSSETAVSGAALAAGVQPGDVIVSVDGVAIEESSDLGEAVRANRPGDVVEITVLRGGSTVGNADTVELSATLGSSLAAGDLVAAIDDELLPGVTDDGSGAVAASELDADVVASALDGTSVGDIVVVGLVEQVDGETIARAIPARVVEDDAGRRTIEGTTLLGVSSGTNFDTIEHSVPAAAVNAVTDIFPTSWEMAKGAVQVLNPVNIFTHLAGTNDNIETRPTTLVGVTGLSDDVGEAEGFIGILFLLAVLNVFVGVFNMFPLLPLDGGHAAIAAYERIREGRSGKRYYADVAKMMPFAMAVMTVLLFLFMSGLYLDITDPIG